MAKIGFVNVCHEDYMDGAAARMAAAAVRSLEARGIEVISVSEPATSSSQAMRAGRELVHQDVEGVVLFLGTWIECPTAMAVLREVEHLPLCLWGFPMFMENDALTSTGSYVSFAMFKGSMDRAGYRYKPVLGLPDSEDTLRQVDSFCRAASCAERLKRLRIGLVGYTSMSIYPGTFDHLLLRTQIGPEVEQVDSYTLIQAAEAIKEDDCQGAVDFLKSQASIREDVEGKDLLRAAKLFLALEKLVSERELHSINVKCQYEFSKQYKMVMCVPLSALAETGIVASCEGDMLNTVSMCILNLLSGNTVSYGDVINHQDNRVKLSSCGFIPFSLGREGKREIRKFLPHPGFHGIQNSFVMKPGRVTVMRLVEDCGGYHLLYLTGEGLETELRQGYMPALDVRLDGRMEDFVRNYSGQHYAIAYGDYSKQLEDLAVILGIKTIRI